jgi:hypothetical protein
LNGWSVRRRIGLGQCRSTRSANEQAGDTTEDNATHQIMERLLSPWLQDLIESSEVRTGGDDGLERELAEQWHGRSKNESNDAPQKSADDESGAKGSSHIGDDLGNAQLDDGYQANKNIVQPESVYSIRNATGRVRNRS